MTRASVSCIIDFLQPTRVRRSRTRLPDRFIRQMLEQAVSQVFMVASADLWSAARGRRRVAFARQVAMYLGHVTCGLSLTEAGHLFSRDRTTVAHACKVIEALRDDQQFDRALELLEGVVRSLSPPSTPFLAAS